jgi:hypothetical protein
LSPRINATSGGFIRARRFTQAALAGASVLAVLGGLAFYLVFPSSLLEDYVYPRAIPSVPYQAAAVVAAGLFMTAIYVVAPPTRARWRGAATLGLLLGLLVSGPAQLALLAVVRSDPWRNVAIILWTTGSWGAAGVAISWVLNRPPPADAKATS